MVDITVVAEKRPLREQAHQVINRLQAVHFGGFDQAVKYRTGIGTTMGVGEQPSFTANYERFNGTLGTVVVDVDAPVG